MVRELYREVHDVDKVVEISFIQPMKSFLSPRLFLFRYSLGSNINSI